MDSFAIVSLVVCGSVGAATLVVGWRWLRRPPPRADSGPAPVPAAAPAREPAKLPQRTVPAVLLPVLDDEPTHPMMRTSWDSTMWPSTQPASDFGSPDSAPTQPLPLKRD